MRLIDADRLKDNCTINYGDTTIGRRLYVMFYEIDDAPTIDAVKVIRCKDCRYYIDGMIGHCRKTERGVATDFFCAYGERWSNAID